MKAKTSHCICGFNFYITWENENVGYDQHGNKWLDKKAPQCADDRVVNIALDTYNTIMKMNSFK